MNTYLYAWHSDERIDIARMKATSLSNCEDKIIQKYSEKFDLDDTLDYDDFIKQLGEDCGVYIGEIYELDEFN